jgi:hypothetical protein
MNDPTASDLKVLQPMTLENKAVVGGLSRTHCDMPDIPAETAAVHPSQACHGAPAGNRRVAVSVP